MALVYNGKISLIAFLAGFLIILVPLVIFFEFGITVYIKNYWLYILACYIFIVNAILLAVSRGHTYQVAVRGCGLGYGLGLALMLCFSHSSYRLFGWYLVALTTFHWLEYFCTAVTNPRNLSLSSYLLDHSKEYHIAAVASMAEFTFEYFLFPGLKLPCWISVVGLILVVGGEVIRKGAMLTASTNFNHYVQYVKREGHVLVTHSFYNWFRHPAYVGFFYWSIGTQLMICNPLCVVAYAYGSWQFFKHRIPEEERTLLNFFGQEYVAYQKRVGTGLPFISGYRVEL